MIGLSVSLCVKDIVEGKVALADVERIIGGISDTDSVAWEYVIIIYRETTWQENPARCEQVFRQLLAEGRVQQPKLKYGKVPILRSPDGSTHWVSLEQEIE